MSYKITASVDWCEQNFAVFPFVAEFWNTFSDDPQFRFACWLPSASSTVSDTHIRCALKYRTLVFLLLVWVQLRSMVH